MIPSDCALIIAANNTEKCILRSPDRLVALASQAHFQLQNNHYAVSFKTTPVSGVGTRSRN